MYQDNTSALHSVLAECNTLSILRVFGWLLTGNCSRDFDEICTSWWMCWIWTFLSTWNEFVLNTSLYVSLWMQLTENKLWWFSFDVCHCECNFLRINCGDFPWYSFDICANLYVELTFMIICGEVEQWQNVNIFSQGHSICVCVKIGFEL